MILNTYTVDISYCNPALNIPLLSTIVAIERTQIENVFLTKVQNIYPV